ncbi:MAG: lytic transglycosylase domain-containing protein [Alicyclobacillaceae bacterium]|nr:lytic transglycosylase domain-containing protein [Alicyclobacillaceae bacterium]
MNNPLNYSSQSTVQNQGNAKWSGNLRQASNRNLTTIASESAGMISTPSTNLMPTNFQEMLLQQLLSTQNSSALTPGVVRTLLDSAANAAPAESPLDQGSLLNLLARASTVSSQTNVTALSSLIQAWLSDLPGVGSADTGMGDNESMSNLSSQAMSSFTAANGSLPISPRYSSGELGVSPAGQFASEPLTAEDLGLANGSLGDLSNEGALPYQGTLPSPYQDAITAASEKYGVPVSLIQAVMEQESGMNPSAVSPAGAMGLMQLMPTTAATYGVSDPFNPTQNIDAGTHYLANLLSQFGGNTRLALAAYNAGPASISKYGGIPPYPQTENYVASVMQRAANLSNF